MKISSDSITGSTKAFIVLPLILLTLIGLLTTLDAIRGRGDFYIPIVIFFGLGVFSEVYRRRIWSLADEVYDEGNSLRFKKGKVDEIIPLSSIQYLENRMASRVPMIGVRIIELTGCGREVRFVPDCSESTYADVNELFLDLSQRIIKEKLK